jgi:hypothetical protein
MKCGVVAHKDPERCERPIKDGSVFSGKLAGEMNTEHTTLLSTFE